MSKPSVNVLMFAQHFVFVSIESNLLNNAIDQIRKWSI